MRRITIMLTALLLALGMLATPAAAHHQHTIHTPGTAKTIPCEPAAAADVHPIHEGLHLAIRDRSKTTKVEVTADGGNPGCSYE
jgi:hypothetical protein